MKISDNKLVAWGTLIGAAAAILTPLGLTIAYEVSTAENVSRCVRSIEADDVRLNSIDAHVANIEGYLRGQREPVRQPKDQQLTLQ
jgi:hypothetical protein